MSPEAVDLRRLQLIALTRTIWNPRVEVDMFNVGISSIAGLLERMFDEASAEQQRRHERRMQELLIIQNSTLRDAYVQQILLDKFLAPIERAQHQIQNTAKYAQWLAEMVNYHGSEHGLTPEQVQDLAKQLRYLAIQITQSDSLYELKLIYAVTTNFTQAIAGFRHQDRKYSLERSIRKRILEPLNTCIATEHNFQRRVHSMNFIQTPPADIQ